MLLANLVMLGLTALAVAPLVYSTLWAAEEIYRALLAWWDGV